MLRMSWTLKKKENQPILTPELYTAIYEDIRYWCIIELTNIPPKQVEGVQTNALLNFATFDLHALALPNGKNQMLKLLGAAGTDQTVMLRLKGLVVDLYIKYGDDIIDELRKRVYTTIVNTYGLDYDIDKDLDINNTFWLHPFIRKMLTELKMQ